MLLLVSEQMYSRDSWTTLFIVRRTLGRSGRRLTQDRRKILQFDLSVLLGTQSLLPLTMSFTLRRTMAKTGTQLCLDIGLHQVWVRSFILQMTPGFVYRPTGG